MPVPPQWSVRANDGVVVLEAPRGLVLSMNFISLVTRKEYTFPIVQN
jgi:hypothetical protein